MTKVNDKTFNKWFNTFILVGMAVVTVVVTAIKFRDADSGRAMLVISAFGSLMGVLCTVLAANGRILTFLFGILDVSIYGVMCIFLAGLIAAYFILAALDKTEAAGVVKWLVFLDAFSMMCNIIGQYLLSTAYMEQWYFWIGVNVSTILMWVLTLRQDPDSAFAHIYIVKYSFYLLNSLNGLRIWYNLSRGETA